MDIMGKSPATARLTTYLTTSTIRAVPVARTGPNPARQPDGHGCMLNAPRGWAWHNVAGTRRSGCYDSHGERRRAESSCSPDNFRQYDDSDR